VCTSPVIRIRETDGKYRLCVKGEGLALREEFELDINKKSFDNLCHKLETGFIVKTRYFIPLADGLLCELDVYGGDLSGLFTAEVEFADIAEYESFTSPEWFGAEITMDKRYKNSWLAKYRIIPD
jgi:CYTH domain-containing protein